jgi:hypothetical protein
MKSLFLKEIVLFIILGIGLWWYHDNSSVNLADKSHLQQQFSDSVKSIKANLTKPPVLASPMKFQTVSIEQAQAKNMDKVYVVGRGKVIRILPDDNIGNKHQRFILQVSNGTILVLHNIDLAPRLLGLQLGDKISFAGEYVRNKQGGVVHWTHRDPYNHHLSGWLLYHGKTYQ